MANIGKIIGDRIKVYRTKLGYSQEFLAEKAGLHPTYIGQIERAETNTSINKIATALDIPLELLFANIITTEGVDNSVPLECYEMINKLTEKEQIAMLELIKCIIKYKEI
ncbi:TPA: helix-turn-helix transcriptional regulator [Clostridioides difficile]|uniref:helix-turn-helix domain-containing protein n=1 Tax=Clostridioides difficile TaxID=1496 RepID=UPI001C1A118A|nr:helix-turn-helix transcriptional regulator [Clostridioides difficile]MDL0373434.1 helix-turn-helix transcriptional regulator [Clostridioides difficile]MDL0392100.1 helix-turn-helix transcriptional regulator [Clostridioides difficile]HBF3703442.1 helix-turn-helix transcriptional regulator [Clostridioides difficile]HBF3706060.1 helix-turn-helix transcriptional regulator [Clostridioides difficile]HBF8714971.1 helix-turn-helix transcriptional regulator [Clostridioides difficile]